jgi:hypothetical protein
MIRSPRRHHFDRPAHPIAAPPSLRSAGASHRHVAIYNFGRRIDCRAALSYFGQRIDCRAAFFIFGRRIQSPIAPLISRPAHPIAHRPSPLLYSGWRIQSPIAPFTIPAQFLIVCRAALSLFPFGKRICLLHRSFNLWLAHSTRSN